MAPMKFLVTQAAFILNTRNSRDETSVLPAAVTIDSSAHQPLSELCNLFDVSPSNSLYVSSSPFGRGVSFAITNRFTGRHFHCLMFDRFRYTSTVPFQKVKQYLVFPYLIASETINRPIGLNTLPKMTT